VLVIRRREGEALLIGDDVEIEILDCTPSHVKLGIRAPREVTVLRKEIYLTGEQNLAAAGTDSPAAVDRLLRTLR
jgi:carbon storage regulator